MNWLFNLVFLGIAWSGNYAEEVISSESLPLPKVEDIELFFKNSFGNASYRKSLDSGRLRLKEAKENPQEDLSYRHHGSHPANAKSWKLQCVWNTLNSGSRRISKRDSAIYKSETLPENRELCDNDAWESCGIDLDNSLCNFTEIYRTIDGTCNNLVHTGWGSAPQPFERFIPSDYGNGVSTFRLSAEGKPLPNARKISRALSKSNKAAQPKVTLMLVQWGQFLDHDITLTPERETNDELRAKYTEHDNIWDFDQCSYFGLGPFYQSKILDECYIKCDETPGCDAFIYYPDYGCYLADCDLPIAAPTWNYPPYKGYSRNSGAVTFVHPPEMSCKSAGGAWTRPSGDVSNSVQGVADCAAKCAGYTYFGLECPRGTVHCQCANTLVGSTSADDCDRQRDHCIGPFTQGGYMMGGADRGSVYLVEPSAGEPVDESSSTMECCDWGQYDNSVSLGVDCIPINVTGDSFYEQNGRECLRFVRSMPTSSGCVNSPMEQINQDTAFVDGSMVYGSTEEVANFVRTGSKGLLNTTQSEHVGNGQPLPPRGGDGFTHQCPIPSEDTCFLAGDVRVDEQPGLTAMHTIFIRLHNIIAEDLCKLNPKWCGDDEQLFQETRRIVIALIQQITYRDWLPLVVGQTLTEKYNLNTASNGYADTYDATVNPTIRNVFATAAFRFGHSLLSEVLKTAKEDENQPFPTNFFNNKLLECSETSPASLLKGLSRCPSAPIDAIVEPAFTNHLYADHPANDGIFYGLDLLSINIQRGRDHGIPGYTAWRDFCDLEAVTDFWKLEKHMPNDLVATFIRLYENVNDIDLFPAGLAENPIADGLLGPTFSCLIARQFSVMKHGDRFWHEREGQPKPFTPEQLSSIRSQDLVSILCRVTEHTSFTFQPNPFKVESEENPVMDCSSYDFINLQPWKENKRGPCPSGMFEIPSSSQCFKLLNQKSWSSGLASCASEGLVMAKPADNIAVALRKYLMDTYGEQYIWVVGRGDGSRQSWARDGSAVHLDLLWPGAESEYTTDRCLAMCAYQDCVNRNPGRPYTTYFCTDNRRVLCEGYCPDGFEANNGNCYWSSKVKGQPPVTWDQAKQQCKDLGDDVDLAELENPNSIGSDVWLMKKFGGGVEGAAWLGGSRDGDNGWVWLHSQRELPLGLSYWHPGDPNGDGRCLEAWGDGHNYYINDLPCHAKRNFVCQKFT